MAGTCPNCGIKISGQLRTCPECGGYCLVTQENCPECGSPLEPVQAPTPSLALSPGKEGQKEPTRPTRRNRAGTWILVITIILLPILGGAGFYYYMQMLIQKEQHDYEQLAKLSNPEFYQEFLSNYPNSPYHQEVYDRMVVLEAEAREWEALQKGINRASVSRFLQKYPSSLRQRLCEDLLDSIDWHDAQALGTEEAITDYLKKHPSGRYVNEAADIKNTLLLTRVTPEERTMIRGTLEAFFSKAIANQDIEAAREAIPDTTMIFCDNQKADAAAIVQYAKEKMEKDVIGLHYIIGQQMNIRRERLTDGNTGFAVEVSLQETISRSDINQPASKLYHVVAKLNQEQKIVSMNIVKE